MTETRRVGDAVGSRPRPAREEDRAEEGTVVRDMKGGDAMQKRTYDAEEVATQLGTSKPYAYKLIRRLNDELEDAGQITIPGKVPCDYFERRLFGQGTHPVEGSGHGR